MKWNILIHTWTMCGSNRWDCFHLWKRGVAVRTASMLHGPCLPAERQMKRSDKLCRWGEERKDSNTGRQLCKSSVRFPRKLCLSSDGTACSGNIHQSNLWVWNVGICFSRVCWLVFIILTTVRGALTLHRCAVIISAWQIGMVTALFVFLVTAWKGKWKYYLWQTLGCWCRAAVWHEVLTWQPCEWAHGHRKRSARKLSL